MWGYELHQYLQGSGLKLVNRLELANGLKQYIIIGMLFVQTKLD